MPPLSIESNEGSTAAVAARRQQQEEHHYHQPTQSPPPLSPASQQKSVLPVVTSSACPAAPAVLPAVSSWESYRRQATTSHSSHNSSIVRRRSSGGSITSKGITVLLPKISEKQVRWVDCDDHDDDDDDYCIEDTSSSSWTLEDLGNDDNDHGDSTAVISSSSTAIDSTSNHSSRSSNSIGTVRVLGLARHYIIPHHEELTDEERSNTYYSSTELKAIHREATSSVRQYQHRQHARRWHHRSSSSSSSFSSSRSNSSTSTSTNSSSPLGSIRKRLTAITGEDDDDETLLRGLESYTTEGYQRIYSNRRIAQGVVLNEQYKFRYQQYQRRRLQDHCYGDVDLDDDDDESLLLHLSNHLAYVSHYNTVTCQDDAIERAQDDAIEAQKVLSQMKGLTSSEQQLEYETDQTSSSTVDDDDTKNTPSSLGCWQVNPLSELLAVVFQPKKDAFVEILKNED
mmetsp:Transcript_32986/g.80176  ORF Transcript_32986/g.80176 Transcript_32986/m.80176 type:complete len:455 (-) Transcript_32986:203-1567(-)